MNGPRAVARRRKQINEGRLSPTFNASTVIDSKRVWYGWQKRRIGPRLHTWERIIPLPHPPREMDFASYERGPDDRIDARKDP